MITSKKALLLLLFVLIRPLHATEPGLGALLIKGDSSGSPMAATQARPLDSLVIIQPGKFRYEAKDAMGRVYAHGEGLDRATFKLGGALGLHKVVVTTTGGIEDVLTFSLDAETSVEDAGRYSRMFNLFRKSMNTYSPTGVSEFTWNGQNYRCFVWWMLDHNHTMKGMRYFSPVGNEFLDIMKMAQREDGMIWSNINLDNATSYYITEYGPWGYIRKIGDRHFVRQPPENHPEYNYVSAVYSHWKASGDDSWMESMLDSMARALDYCMNDRARWSSRFELLKRVYTIDSWDFQVDDAYTPDIGLNRTMVIDPDRSKFGVFFGDNIYYAAACDELAEMFRHAGREKDAITLVERASKLRERLEKLSWNGRFYTHFIEEDASVVRDLGVDERSQIAQGNAYSLNRNLRNDQVDAIIGTYKNLKANLPEGSPGEWYSIYPPFKRGFGSHNPEWQYMNGGVGAHVAGELARGAFSHGEETYGRDILDRLTALGEKHGGKVHFSYTGAAIPPPPPASYTTIEIGSHANMSLKDDPSLAYGRWMLGKGRADDIASLPTGRQILDGVPFEVAFGTKDRPFSVVAVGTRPGLPASISIPINAIASAVYLLHTATKTSADNPAGAMVFEYEDGTTFTQSLLSGKQLTYWWFPKLETPRSGVAWRGPSGVSADVGLSWCALDNPSPERKIKSLTFLGQANGGIYALVGVTLSNQPHFVPPGPISYGGPDNWSAAASMAALIEGLIGVNDSPLTEKFSHPLVTPRFDASVHQELSATVRYAASTGYVSYRYSTDPANRQIGLWITGAADSGKIQVLLPPDHGDVINVQVEGQAVPCVIIRERQSAYASFILSIAKPTQITVQY